MTIYGGFYHEKSILPEWNQIYGSSGRAAAILSNFTKDIVLNTFYEEENYLKYFSNQYGIKYNWNYSPFNIEFNYFHTFSTPIINLQKANLKKLPSVKITDHSVICFGTLENEAPIIESTYAIFDFQSSKFEELYSNKNLIEHVTFILNFEEAKYISEKTTVYEIQKFFFETIKNLEILIIKNGPFGGYVYTKDTSIKIPIYKTDFIFKIGTGDIFTSVFSYFWINNASNELELSEIVNYASFATAYYSKNYKNLYKRNFLKYYENNKFKKIILDEKLFKNKVYLAGPFFNTSQRWHIEDVKSHLEKLNFNVFSPIHDVGMGESKQIAESDLEGLNNSDCVFAILNNFDPGTVFEIGYAIAKGKKVVILFEYKDEVNMTMFKGTNCLIFNDITTALYNLVWEMTSE